MGQQEPRMTHTPQRRLGIFASVLLALALHAPSGCSPYVNYRSREAALKHAEAQYSEDLGDARRAYRHNLEFIDKIEFIDEAGSKEAKQ